MHRGAKLLTFTIALLPLMAVNSFGQSGRGRPPAPPPPQPTTKPKGNVPGTTVLGIPEGGKLTKQDLSGATSRFLLRNGLTVIIRERHSSPLVAINVTVKAGSANESDEMAGMARLMRHMILRGTAKRPGAAVEDEVAQLGGLLTSQVSYDRTSFTLIAPAESYQAMVELMADLIQHPAFDPDDLKKAAQSVILESKREQDSIETGAVERMFAAAFTANRLKRGSSVSESMLASVTREQALGYYQNFYQPAETIVTVIGDIFSLQALGQVQLQFGTYAKSAVAKPAAKPTPRPVARDAASAETPAPPATDPTAPVAEGPFSPNPEEPTQDRLRYANSRADIGSSIVTIGYRTPAFKSDKEGLNEMATLEMLAAVLGLGNSSRLWQGLREGQASRDKIGVATGTGLSHHYLPGTGMLIARLRVDPDRIDRAEAEYFREIERFRRELISDGELQRARIMLEKRYYDVIERLENEAGEVARYQAQFGDYRLFDSILARIRAVSAADIQQAAAKYLSLANGTVHEYEPRNAAARTFTAEKFAELIVTLAPGTVQPINPEEVKPATALKTFAQGAERAQAADGQNIIVASVPLPIKDFSVLRGPRAYVREDRSQPKLAVSVLFQGGRFIEDQTTSGITELMLRTMLKSTTSRKADLIALELESYGGQIHIVNEPDFFGYTLEVLSRNSESAIKLLLDIIEKPFFDKDEVAKERNALLAEQIQERDDENSRATELMWASLYPGHPYGLPRFGLAEVVKGANDDKLEAWHAKTIKRQFPLVVLVGDTDGSSLVSRIFAEGLKRDEVDKSLKVNLPKSSTPPQEKVERRARQLTVQALGFRLPDQPANQPPAQPSDLMATVMLGKIATSGRLVEEMRNKQVIVDGASVKVEQQLASGVFFTKFATLPETEQKAREAIMAELKRLAATPPSDDEFEGARNSTIGGYAVALQSNPDRALEYARAVILGRKATDVESQPDFVRAVKKADIKRAAETVIKVDQIGRGVVRGEAAQAPAKSENASNKN